MTVFKNIDDSYLEQIFPEKFLSVTDRRYIFLYSIGLDFNEIGDFSHKHPMTIKKALHESAERFFDSSALPNLRRITLIRVFSMVGYHTLNKVHTLF